MKEKVFTAESLGVALKSAKSGYSKIYVPVKTGDYYQFENFTDDATPVFNYSNTKLSPKGLIYPQSMRMFSFSIDSDGQDSNILKEIPREYHPIAVVGIRPCDSEAFLLVKKNFDNPEYRDPWWVSAYESATFVGLACNEPCSTCFCSSVGGAPFSEKGLDAIIVDLGDKFYIKSITEKGETFLSFLGDECSSPEENDAQSIVKLASDALKKCNSEVKVDNLAKKKQLDLFYASFWENQTFSCLNCGVCTSLCPTCWCFDIQDEIHGSEGERIRNWDSCMFPLFTLHGSGHNPREEKYSRPRQRFMHKLKYYVDKYKNGVQCTGCGRCVRSCPVNIDIRNIAHLMNSLN